MHKEIRLLRAALELVWRLHLRKHTHLGWERASGIEAGCIPCICACALGHGMDETTAEELEEQVEKLKKAVPA